MAKSVPNTTMAIDLGSGVVPDNDYQLSEQLRQTEYPQVIDKVYLDHAGTTLYAKSLIRDFSSDMMQNLYGNPHSESTPSRIASLRVDAVRARALRFFGADPTYWDLVFVPNATAAIKLTADIFRDYSVNTGRSTSYNYHKDAHTSLVGARQLFKKHHCFANDQEVDRWMNKGSTCRGRKAERIQLFAFPGQSNMTGRRLPLRWCSQIRHAFSRSCAYTLLDAAALATTAPLRLADPDQCADFIALSFYKIFGFPDLGALLMQKRCWHLVQEREFFGGGTVDMVTTMGDSWHASKTTSIHDRLECGTVPFHSIIALDHAMAVHQNLYGPDPMTRISSHTSSLARILFDDLSSLHHHNGRPVIRVYRDDNVIFGDPNLQGAVMAMNVLRADGSTVGYADVERAADKQQIYVRSGSLCNPGGFASYLKWSSWDMKAAYAAGHSCSNPKQIVYGKPTGVVRVSLGAMSNLSDVHSFVDFIRSTYIDTWSETEVVAGIAAPALPEKFTFAGRLMWTIKSSKHGRKHANIDTGGTFCGWTGSPSTQKLSAVHVVPVNALD